MNVDETLFTYFMDSLKDPFVFVDMNHIIQYMNREAKERFKGKPAEVGRSIFDCHNELSNKIIVEICEKFKEGLEEELITDNKKYRVYMRAVRDNEGNCIGYYERYEPPKLN